MENVLGMMNDKPSRARSIVLRNNGIKNRYYALRDGKPTHSNAEMGANAIRLLFDDQKSIDKLELLTAGTTSPEQILPSHAAMIHGELKIQPIELLSGTGACCSSMQGLKYAFLSVGAGMSDMAASCGSERFSSWLHASRFQPEAENLSKLEENPFIAFEKDFLRWMLSDGAGAALLEAEPNADGLSLRMDWIDMISYANELETCMYAGAVKHEDGSITGWNDMPVTDWTDQSVFSLKQDTRLLGDNIVPKGGQFLKTLMDKHNFSVDDIDYFLPHMSSEFFKGQIVKDLKQIGLEIPMEKWFYNLPKVGNVGSASPYLMLEELMHSDKMKKGDRILVMVPESARFTYAYIYLTVV